MSAKHEFSENIYLYGIISKLMCACKELFYCGFVTYNRMYLEVEGGAA